MSKVLVFFVSFFLSFNLFASKNFENNNYYFNLKKTIFVESDIITFFSFYCPHCYKFEKFYYQNIKKKLPKKIKIKEYHISFLGGPIGNVLTQAWSIAIVLGIENKIKAPLFNAFHYRKIKNENDIKKIFNHFANISNKEYEYFLNSIPVKFFIVQQERTSIVGELVNIPAFLIKGKYLINLDSINRMSVKSFIQEYSDLIKYLLQKK